MLNQDQISIARVGVQGLAEAEAELLRRNGYKMRRYFQDTGPYRRELYPKAVRFFEAGAIHRERAMIAANRIGKALRHGTPVATPDGWIPIEQLRVGDTIVAGDGTLTRIVGVFPQGRKRLLRCVFDGRDVVDCCPDHLWVYQHPRARYPYRRSHRVTERNPFFGQWRVASARTMRLEVGRAPAPRGRAIVPTSEPWQLPARDVPLDPYVLGVLLGDGGLANGTVRFTAAEPFIVEQVRAAVPPEVEVKPASKGDTIEWTVKSHRRTPRGYGWNPVLDVIRALHCEVGSPVKSIPALYRLNSPVIRLAILQGLMDTDGSIATTGAMEFSSTSRQLADDVLFLVHSLGGRGWIEPRQTAASWKPGLPSYRVHIALNRCPFRLPRKAARWNPRRDTAHRVLHRMDWGEEDFCTCIAVAHPSKTFVTAHGIVTHNTEAGCFEVSAHLTGEYPHWWVGKRWDYAVRGWAAGTTGEKTKEIVQAKLIGPEQARGTGMIPAHRIYDIQTKGGGAIESVWVRHVNGGLSELKFKSFEMGRKAFEGTEQHVIWLDEEPPEDVYVECLLRTMATGDMVGGFAGGVILMTFTPLQGSTKVVNRFMVEGVIPANGIVEDEPEGADPFLKRGEF